MIASSAASLPVGCLACGPSLETMLGMYALVVGVPSLGVLAAGYACRVTTWEHGRALGRSVGRIGLGITLTLAALSALGAGISGAGSPYVHWSDILLAFALVGLLSALPLTCSALAIRMNRPPPMPNYPRCAECGYNLTGLIEPRCPECGRKFIAADEQRAERAAHGPARLES